MKTRITHRSAWTLALGIVALTVLCHPPAARACDTPVYRYAMYNWPAAPYRVFYFHHGAPAAEDEAVNTAIDALGEDREAPANVFVDSIDLSKTELDKLPQPVKDAFEASKDGEPAYLVFTPWGVNLFSGRLDADTIKAMTDSPARTRVGKLLEEGNAALMLFVPGKDEKENARVEKEIAELIRRGASGEIPVDAPLALPPVAAGAEGDQSEEDALAEAARTKIAMLKVDRSDPAEQWLIRSLMTIEPDLPELADEPMVFPVYGRARALEPYVGKGITADNLTEVVMFLGSACSCTVKEMNPGADLLVKWDWDSTAETWAATDPSFNAPPYGYGYGYDEYPATATEEPAEQAEPETAAEPAPPAEPATASEPATPAEAATPAEPEALADAGAVMAAAAEGAVAGPPPESLGPETKTSVPAAEPPAPGETQAAVEPPPGPAPGAATPPASAPAPSFASRQLWMYGLGLAAAAVVVLGLGFVLIRKQSA